MTSRVAILVGALSVFGCDGGGGSDAGAGVDAAAPGGDAAMADPDGGMPLLDAGSDAGAAMPDGGIDVDDCRAAAAALAAACPSDGSRTCHAGAYASYCAAGARPDRLAEGLGCLLAMSDASGGCRTFSDPSGADTCVDAAFDGVTDPVVTAIVTRISVLCGDDSIQPTRTEPPLFVLSAAQLDALRSCVDAAADCAATGSCSEAFQAPIAACYP